MNTKLSELMELIEEYSNYNQQYKQCVLNEDRESEEYNFIFNKLEEIEDEIIELVSPKFNIQVPEPYILFLILLNVIQLTLLILKLS